MKQVKDHLIQGLFGGKEVTYDRKVKLIDGSTKIKHTCNCDGMRAKGNL